MKSFLNQIDDFPESAKFQSPLKEMLSGSLDQIQKEWDEVCQEMEVLQKELQYRLDQVVLLREF